MNARSDMMTEQEVRDFIRSSSWCFAKSMANIPHEYTLIDRTNDLPTFQRFVRHIRANGYEQKFFSKTFTYFDIDGRCYWTMGAPVEQTTLINRAAIR